MCTATFDGRPLTDGICFACGSGPGQHEAAQHHHGAEEVLQSPLPVPASRGAAFRPEWRHCLHSQRTVHMVSGEVARIRKVLLYHTNVCHLAGVCQRSYSGSRCVELIANSITHHPVVHDVLGCVQISSSSGLCPHFGITICRRSTAARRATSGRWTGWCSPPARWCCWTSCSRGSRRPATGDVPAGRSDMHSLPQCPAGIAMTFGCVFCGGVQPPTSDPQHARCSQALPHSLTPATGAR